jgi:hypothetical protein
LGRGEQSPLAQTHREGRRERGDLGSFSSPTWRLEMRSLIANVPQGQPASAQSQEGEGSSDISSSKAVLTHPQ